MAISSINTNLAALLAQANIGTATDATNLNVAQLSSGNRIIQASDDVAALAAGTALQSQVNTLTTALSVASQGSSLLQVADGALAQIQSILQRQQAIATQAQSGSLSSTQLGFLNQEFQNLTQEIDQLSGSTNFNGVNLINGDIQGGSNVATNTAIDTTSAQTSAAFITLGANASGGDTVTVDGVKVTFTTFAAGTAAASGDVVVGSSATNTASNLAAFLNASGNPAFANLAFVASAGDVNAVYTGGHLSGTLNITASASFTSGSNTAAATTISSGGTNGLGPDTYSAVGSVTGDLLVAGDTTAQSAGAPINVLGLENNTAFIGSFPSIGAISGLYGNSAGHATFSITVGNDTYSTSDTTLDNSGNVVALTFTGTNTNSGLAEGGAFTLNINGSTLASTDVSSQEQVDGIAQQLNQALSGVTIYQNRQVQSLTGNQTTSVSGVQTATLQGAQLNFHSSSFANPVVSSISVSAPQPGSSDAKISLVINGQTYNSIAGIGDQIKTNSIVTLQNANNPNQTVQLLTGNTAVAGSSNSTAIDLTSASNAAAFQATLASALGIGSGNAALTFQVGSLSTDTIGVSIGSASSSSLFGGASLDVLTQPDATTAAGALTTALNTVTSLRAGVGALEERFNFASSAIQSASQNEGAAKSTLLDTDVASTSTAFATAQVQLQAGIAVLAQANQLPQNLLKLIA